MRNKRHETDNAPHRKSRKSGRGPGPRRAADAQRFLPEGLFPVPHHCLLGTCWGSHGGARSIGGLHCAFSSGVRTRDQNGFLIPWRASAALLPTGGGSVLERGVLFSLCPPADVLLLV